MYFEKYPFFFVTISKVYFVTLKDMYEELGDDQFEVIFVSFDRTEDAQKEYMQELHGDWVTIPFGDPLIQ